MVDEKSRPSMGSRITLRHLRCFAAVADTGSFTLAANRLFQTQSSLTATIKQLEEFAGLKLFDRTTRRVEMTKEAIWFKEVAERVLRDFDVAVADLEAMSRSDRGRMSIAASDSVVAQVLMPVLGLYRGAHPQVSVTIEAAGSDRVERAVLASEIDFGLGSRVNGFAELEYRALFADTLGVIVPPGHRLCTSTGPVAWNDIGQFKFVSLTEDTGVGAILSHHRERGLPPVIEGSDLASSGAALYSLMKLGGRICVLPSLAAASVPLSEFSFRTLREPVIERETYLLTRRGRSLSPNSQRLLDIMLKWIASSALPNGLRRL